MHHGKTNTDDVLEEVAEMDARGPVQQTMTGERETRNICCVQESAAAAADER